MSYEELDEQFLAIDVGVLAELEDNDSALELVQMYNDETKAVLTQLETYTTLAEGAQTQPAWSSIWAFLHKLKGSSLSIGLCGVAEFIESLRSSDTSTLPEWYPRVFEQLKYAVETSVHKIHEKLAGR
jgi:HPt (histidine-containing phosphotransfer) domain-containing protein